MQSTLSPAREQTRTLFFTPWRLACIAVCILSAAIYARALKGMAIWDDVALLSGAGTGGHTLLHCFTRPFLEHYFRPLVSLSFYLDYTFQGDTTFFYHQTNILIHLLTTACLMGLLLCAFRSRKIALLGGLLFAVQPVQVSAVAWIGGRTDSLCALFMVLFAWPLVAAVQAQGRQRTLYLAASAAAYAAALLTKEQTLSLLPLVPLAFACFADKERGQPRGIGWRASIPFALLCIVYTLVWLLGFPSLHANMHGLWEQLGLCGRSLLYYSLVLVTPTPHWIHVTSLGGMLRAGSFTIWLGYGLLAVYLLLLWRWRRASPAAAWFLAMALLAILPVSNLIPIPTLTVAPYRAAESGIGVVALLSWALVQATRSGFTLRRDRRLAIACSLPALAYLLWCTGLTLGDMPHWSDGFSANTVFARDDPDSVFARLNLIGDLLNSRQQAQAGQQTKEMLARIFGSPAWQQADTAWRAYRTEPAIAYYIRHSMGNNTRPETWIAILYARLSASLSAQGDRAGSLAALQIGQRIDPGSADVNLGLGEHEYALGKEQPAIAYLTRAQAADPRLPDTYRLLARIYTQERKWTLARAQYQAWIGLQYWVGPAYLGLAEAQEHLGDIAGAEATLRAAQSPMVVGAEQAKAMLAHLRTLPSTP